MVKLELGMGKHIRLELGMSKQKHGYKLRLRYMLWCGSLKVIYLENLNVMLYSIKRATCV